MNFQNGLNRGSGNRCGHNPFAPSLNLPTPIKMGVGGLPRVLTMAMERCSGYFADPSTLPSLNAANRSERRQRSERRESCVRVLKALLKLLDVASLRVGTPLSDGNFALRSMDEIVAITGLGYRRVERAIRDLKSANILTVAQQREKLSSGEWRGFYGVRAISKHFFGALGLELMLSIERKRASKRGKAKETQFDQENTSARLTGLAKVRLSMGGATSNAATKHRTSGGAKIVGNGQSNGALDQERRRRWSILVADLHGKGMTLEQAKEEAKKILGFTP